MNNKILIGNRYDYVEFGSNERVPVTVTNILYDGFVFLVEFKGQNGRGGYTQYPEKLKSKKVFVDCLMVYNKVAINLL